MKNRLLALFAALVLILPTYLFFFGDKFYTFHDEVQVANLEHYFRAMDAGQFPPRWAADMHFTYGSPLLSFNYQLPYYLGYLGHLLGLPLTVIFKLLMAISVILGAVGMFFLGEFLTGSLFLAIFAAVFYSYTPYQAVDHFIRGTPGESFALAIFPWILLALFVLAKRISLSRVFSLSVLFALLIISHQPAALFAIPFFSLIFIPPALFTGRFKFVAAYLLSLLFSLLLSAYYLIPVLIEKQFIIAGGPFNYLDHFPFIRQLIYSAWTYQGSNPFSPDTMSFQIGLVNLFVLLASLVYFFVLLKKKPKDNFNRLVFIFMLLVTFATIFLMNIRSNFIWSRLSLLAAIQFPWRLLMFTTIFTPVLFLLMARNIKSKWLVKFSGVLLVAVIGINVGYFRPGLITDRTDEYYLRRLFPTEILLSGETVSADYLREAEDYAPLPIRAIRPQALPKSKLTADKPTTKIIIKNDNPLAFTASVKSGSSAVLTFHTFAYPGWTVFVNGQPTSYQLDEIGAITFEISPGEHEVRVAFLDTPVRAFSNIISLGATLSLALWSISKLIKRVTPTA